MPFSLFFLKAQKHSTARHSTAERPTDFKKAFPRKRSDEAIYLSTQKDAGQSGYLSAKTKHFGDRVPVNVSLDLVAD